MSEYIKKEEALEIVKIADFVKGGDKCGRSGYGSKIGKSISRRVS